VTKGLVGQIGPSQKNTEYSDSTGPLFSGNFSAAINVSKTEDMVMKAYLANVPTAIWALIALPGLVLTRCVVTAVVPQVVHAVVPEVVRNVLRVI
jgi:hypothetical protein